MRSKKNTNVEKMVFLLAILSCFFIIISLVLLIIINQAKSIHVLLRIILSIILFILPILLIIIVRICVIKPLKHQKLLTEKFIQGQIYREFIDESGKIYPGLEDALNHIDSLLNNQQLSQEAKERSEFLALQNQINPHFLYNTLEAIRGDALSEGIDYLADITESLSTFYRYSVTDTGSLVTLSDELENVDNYFKIQQYRFGEKLELIYDIPEDREDILDLMCPKLTLQPIVENAIFHGLEKRVDKGTIRIRLELTDNKLIITIIDNGVGMDSNTLDALNSRLKQNTYLYSNNDDKTKKGGIALINVGRRIKLLFGENYGIHVFSIPDIGTDVRITLPIVNKNLGYNYEKRIINN